MVWIDLNQTRLIIMTRIRYERRRRRYYYYDYDSFHTSFDPPTMKVSVPFSAPRTPKREIREWERENNNNKGGKQEMITN